MYKISTHFCKKITNKVLFNSINLIGFLLIEYVCAKTSQTSVNLKIINLSPYFLSISSIFMLITTKLEYKISKTKPNIFLFFRILIINILSFIFFNFFLWKGMEKIYVITSFSIIYIFWIILAVYLSIYDKEKLSKMVDYIFKVLQKID